MGVYIKGMVMPDNCMKCILRVRDKNKSWCLVSGKRLARSLLEIMPSGCPLIEVPEPHGRLIDADAYYANKCENQYYFLKDAPTVIEAEDE